MADVAVREPAWLAARRERAAELSGQLDLPTFKGHTGWEFTDLGDFSLDAFEPAGGAAAGGALFEPVLEAPEEAPSLVQVDAWSDGGDRSPQAGVTVMPLAEAAAQHPELVEHHLGSFVELEDADAFVAANERGWEAGAFVHVAAGVRAELPLVLAAVSAQPGSVLHRRTLVVIEEGAEAEVWEQLVSASAEAALVNAVTEVVVGQNARLRYACAQDLNERSYLFANQRAGVARDGRLEWVALGFGSATGRVRMVTTLAGPGADATVTGAYAPHARQHVDYDTFQEHAAPNCRSDLAFRGILADRSSSVWRGMIKVDPGAQQTDAFQECRNLLLTKRAHADAIPGLEILANDVRCTHAAAVAQIDAEQLFYLRSRGLDPATAKRLIVEGFLAALVERFEAESPLRPAAAGALERRLESVLGA